MTRFFRSLFLLFLGGWPCALTAQEGPPPSQLKADNPQPVVTGKKVMGGDPVDLFTGNLEMDEEALSIRTRHGSFDLVCRYQSGTSRNSLLGDRWNLSCLEHVVVEGNTVFHFDGRLGIDAYVDSGGSFASPRGVFAKLRRLPGSAGYQLRSPDGTVTTFGWLAAACPWHSGQTWHPTVVEPRNGDRLTFAYEEVGPPGFRISRPTTISDVYGRGLTLAYSSPDITGRISSITDFSGRVVRFVRDDANNLTEIVRPPTAAASSGTRTRFDYGATLSERQQHRALRAFAAAEIEANPTNPTPYLVNTYDASHRVVQQTVGGVNASGVAAGGRYHFVYDVLPSWQPLIWEGQAIARRTLMVEPGGSVELKMFTADGPDAFTYVFAGRLLPGLVGSSDTVDTLTSLDSQAPRNPYTNTLRSAHAAYQPPTASAGSGALVIVRSHDGEGLETVVEAPGVRIVNVYDVAAIDRHARGNLLRTDRCPVPDDGSGPNSWLYAYEPLFQQIRGTVDPRGCKTGFVPQNGGAASAARYASVHTFDYQEAGPNNHVPLAQLILDWGIDLNQASMLQQLASYGWQLGPVDPAGVGDLNGDGTTAQAFGNLIVRRQPTVAVLRDATLPSSGYVRESIETRLSYNRHALVRAIVGPEGERTEFEYYSAADPTGQQGGSSTANGGLIAKERRPEGVTITHLFDGLGRPIGTINGRGFRTQRAFDALDQCTLTVDPVGGRTEWRYDAGGNLIEETFDNRVPTLDGTGRPTGQSAVTRITNRWQYDILGNKLREDLQADRAGVSERLVTRYRYDASGACVLTLRPLSVTARDHVECVVFDEQGRAWKEARGGVPAEFLATPGNATIVAELGLTVGDALRMAVHTTSYDQFGNVGSVADAENKVTTLAYDAFRRVVRVTNPLGNYATIVWDPVSARLETALFERITGGDRLMFRSHERRDEAGRTYQWDRAFVNTTSGAALADGALSLGDGARD